MPQLFKAAVLYFAAVFAFAFALGAVRVLWVVPRLGVRTAELLELPIIALASVVVARWIALRTPDPTPPRLLAVGSIALALVLTAEISTIVFVRHITVGEFVASHDPVSGVAFLIVLGLFGVMPAIVGPGRLPPRQAPSSTSRRG